MPKSKITGNAKITPYYAYHEMNKAAQLDHVFPVIRNVVQETKNRQKNDDVLKHKVAVKTGLQDFQRVRQNDLRGVLKTVSREATMLDDLVLTDTSLAGQALLDTKNLCAEYMIDMFVNSLNPVHLLNGRGLPVPDLATAKKYGFSTPDEFMRAYNAQFVPIVLRRLFKYIKDNHLIIDLTSDEKNKLREEIRSLGELSTNQTEFSNQLKVINRDNSSTTVPVLQVGLVLGSTDSTGPETKLNLFLKDNAAVRRQCNYMDLLKAMPGSAPSILNLVDGLVKDSQETDYRITYKNAGDETPSGTTAQVNLNDQDSLIATEIRIAASDPDAVKKLNADIKILKKKQFKQEEYLLQLAPVKEIADSIGIKLNGNLDDVIAELKRLISFYWTPAGSTRPVAETKILLERLLRLAETLQVEQKMLLDDVATNDRKAAETALIAYVEAHPTVLRHKIEKHGDSLLDKTNPKAPQAIGEKGDPEYRKHLLAQQAELNKRTAPPMFSDKAVQGIGVGVGSLGAVASAAVAGSQVAIQAAKDLKNKTAEAHNKATVAEYEPALGLQTAEHALETARSLSDEATANLSKLVASLDTDVAEKLSAVVVAHEKVVEQELLVKSAAVAVEGAVSDAKNVQNAAGAKIVEITQEVEKASEAYKQVQDAVETAKSISVQANVKLELAKEKLDEMQTLAENAKENLSRFEIAKQQADAAADNLQKAKPFLTEATKKASEAGQKFVDLKTDAASYAEVVEQTPLQAGEFDAAVENLIKAEKAIDSAQTTFQEAQHSLESAKNLSNEAYNNAYSAAKELTQARSVAQEAWSKGVQAGEVLLEKESVLEGSISIDSMKDLVNETEEAAFAASERATEAATHAAERLEHAEALMKDSIAKLEQVGEELFTRNDVFGDAAEAVEVATDTVERAQTAVLNMDEINQAVDKANEALKSVQEAVKIAENVATQAQADVARLSDNMVQLEAIANDAKTQVSVFGSAPQAAAETSEKLAKTKELFDAVSKEAAEATQKVANLEVDAASAAEKYTNVALAEEAVKDVAAAEIDKANEAVNLANETLEKAKSLCENAEAGLSNAFNEIFNLETAAHQATDTASDAVDNLLTAIKDGVDSQTIAAIEETAENAFNAAVQAGEKLSNVENLIDSYSNAINAGEEVLNSEAALESAATAAEQAHQAVKTAAEAANNAATQSATDFFVSTCKEAYKFAGTQPGILIGLTCIVAAAAYAYYYTSRREVIDRNVVRKDGTTVQREAVPFNQIKTENDKTVICIRVPDVPAVTRSYSTSTPSQDKSGMLLDNMIRLKPDGTLGDDAYARAKLICLLIGDEKQRAKAWSMDLENDNGLDKHDEGDGLFSKRLNAEFKKDNMKLICKAHGGDAIALSVYWVPVDPKSPDKKVEFEEDGKLKVGEIPEVAIQAKIYEMMLDELLKEFKDRHVVRVITTAPTDNITTKVTEGHDAKRDLVGPDNLKVKYYAKP